MGLYSGKVIASLNFAYELCCLQAGELERVEQEINVKLQGIGLSLVNNLQCREIAYMAVTR